MVSPLILLCLLRALWRTLRHGGGYVVSGHDYEGDERPTPDNIHVVVSAHDVSATVAQSPPEGAEQAEENEGAHHGISSPSRSGPASLPEGR